MLFSVGTKVKFLHSKDEGVVSAILSEEMVNVILDADGIEIPAFIDDLVRFEDAIDQNPSVKAKIVPGKQAKQAKRPAFPAAESQYNILKSKGLQIAFAPRYEADGTINFYETFLINDTKTDILYDLNLDLKGKGSQNFHGKLPSMSFISLDNLLFDDLNDSPTYHFKCNRISTEGTGKSLTKTVKIRPKQFFKQVRTAPLINERVHLYIVFENLDPNKEKKAEDLQSYTKRNATIKKWKDPNIYTYNSIDINEVAAFIPEIDLHIEKIAPESGKKSNSEILHLQLNHADAFIAKAIRLGQERVFLIHGVGKGRLRDAIASRLLQMPEVVSFKNEYHPRYGYGATEVILR